MSVAAGAVDLADLGFDEGAHLLVARGLARHAAVRVTGTKPARGRRASS